MAIAHVQQIGGVADNLGTTLSITPSTATTAGDAIVAAVTWYPPSGSYPTCSLADSQGNVYTTLYSFVGSATSGPSVLIAIAPNAKALGTTDSITATFSSGPYAVMIADEWSGVSSTLDGSVVAASATSAGTSVGFGPLTTTNADDLVLCYIASEGNLRATTWSTGWLGTEFQTASPSLSVAWELPSAAGSFSGTATIGGAEYWDYALFALTAASSSAGSSVALAGGAASQSSAGGALASEVALGGFVQSSSTAGASANATQSLAAAAAASSAASATLSVLAAVAGPTESTSSSAGALALAVGLEGSISSVSAARAQLAATAALTGTASAESSGSGALTLSGAAVVALAGSVQSQSGASAAEDTGLALAGETSGSGSAEATVSLASLLLGGVDAASSSAGTVTAGTPTVVQARRGRMLAGLASAVALLAEVGVADGVELALVQSESVLVEVSTTGRIEASNDQLNVVTIHAG